MANVSLKSLVIVSAFASAGCSDSFFSSKVADHSTPSTMLATTVDSEGNYSAAIDPTQTNTQIMRATGGLVDGSAIALPAGSLSIPITVTIGPGASLTSASSTEQLGLPANGVAAAGPSVSFMPSKPVEASAAFTLSIPINQATSLALQDSLTELDNLVVIYKTISVDNGATSYNIGILPRHEITVGTKAVQFQTTKFGTFQLAVSVSPVLKKFQTPTTKAPVLISTVSPPSSVTYWASSAIYVVGTAITVNTSSVTGGTPDSYSVSPALPAGLSIDKKTGSISGTPTTVTATADYIVTALNEAGRVTCVLRLGIEAAAATTVVTVPPSVTNISSPVTNGMFGAGDGLSIEITFSDAVTVTGTPQLQLETGTTDNLASYVSGSGTTVLTFAYIVLAGDTSGDLDYKTTSSLTLNSGTIQRASGTAAILNLPAPGAAGSLGANKALVLVPSALPTISAIANRTTPESTATSAIAFTIGDSDTAVSCSSTFLSLVSSNATLVNNANVAWSGSAPNCYAVITPQSAVTGTVTLTITVADGTGGSNSSTFSLGILAPFVLGQVTDNASANNQRGMRGPSSQVVAGGKLFVVDSSHNRILVWNSVPSSSHASPDFALGQPNLNSILPNNGGVTASSMNTPSSVYSDGTHLFVADQANHRVLIWNALPASMGQAADVVLGQTGGTTNSANRGSVASSDTLNYPSAVFSDGTNLIVSDKANNRVLIWNAVPTTSGTAADLVVGQGGFSGSASGTSATELSAPKGIYSNGTELYVADSANHRVLIWNTFPSSSGAAADIALGQPNLTSGGSNTGGLSSATLYEPTSVFSTGTKLYVADTFNHRVLVWNSIPTSMGQSADFALGQANMTSALWSAATGSTMIYPKSVYSNGTKLYVSDWNNHRVLVWTSVPSSNGETANFVLGQSDLTTAVAANPGPAGYSLNQPHASLRVGAKLLVSDTFNNRILVWNTAPTTTGQTADFAIGQSDLTSILPNRGGAASDVTLKLPRGLATNGTKLFVADSGNNRVLIWDTIPTSSSQAADLVLGQSLMNVSNPNGGGSAGASTMSQPVAVFVMGTKLFVADTANNRVLAWTSLPTSNAEPASFSLGQSNLSGSTANDGGLSGSTLSQPTGVYSDATRLFVADFANHRVLQWNTLPTSNGESASLVLGQSIMTANSAGTGNAAITSPASISGFGTKLFVSDSGNSRVLVWGATPTTSGEAATSVLGQFSFSGFTPNSGGLSISTLNRPYGIFYDSGYLYISDKDNHRIVAQPIP